MRTLGILLLSLTPALFGLEYRNLYKKRMDFLKIFYEFIIFVKEQIRFCGREKDEIFALATKDPRFALPIFESMQNTLNSEEKLSKIYKKYIDIRLSKQEQNLISSFIINLGKSDTEGQINHCDFYKLQFEKICEKEESAYKTKSKLCITLALSLSAVIFILMI